jgi:hypothetical protein
MKTPREVLLERHQSAERKLDRIREQVLSKTLLNATGAEAGDSARREPWVMRLGRMAWRELIWPSRYAWGGMAAVWLTLFAINHRIQGPVRVSLSAHSRTTPTVLQPFAEQRRWLTELLQPAEPPIAERPRSNSRPRSEKPMIWKMS